jgi:hypothetical protein
LFVPLRTCPDFTLESVMNPIGPISSSHSNDDPESGRLADLEN